MAQGRLLLECLCLKPTVRAFTPRPQELGRARDPGAEGSQQPSHVQWTQWWGSWSPIWVAA